ncbi:hypothetical protein TTHERM_01080430 (macronuclear) [Tetrahymena thermophila SB210]|uniref:RNA-editing substrate-binding complex 6 protein domain-containing protein n=1 Tax=Tetrahymena thermophila (strain SB210) TaxID=312017 RepID=Q22C27_TETTS|nr:hypothetical protein TTHERM_01080430 [Tetrahymena thermophila SB210]EAR82835.1 hypothetical protein TTHERM_01080430 [Tetrahymena thermophila SB210]|eukprot:XP_001030498.1 hypothetical protein TTHERM_01080430 [Tetrahymena thermophila SB210]
MISKSLKVILQLAKQKDKKKFLNAIEDTKVLDNLDKLNCKDTSQLIYSFSKVDINDMRYWKLLNKQFLKIQSGMNTFDLIMCSYAFAKNYLSSPSRYMHKENQEVINMIWQQLEVSILKNQNELMIQQQQSSNIGLLMYSFHILNKGSPQLWNMMLGILINQIQNIDQRNLAMCCYVLSKRNIGDDSVWKNIANHVIDDLKQFTWKNVIIIIYSFSRMNKGDSELWQVFEETVIYQTQRRSLSEKHVNQKGGTILPARDISQILWSFASLKQGSQEFWETMENLLIDNSSNMDFKTFNKCLFSFYFAEKGSQEFWKFISEMQLYIPSKFDVSILDDILFLSRIYQAKMDEKIASFNFAPLVQKFSQILQSNEGEQILLESRAKISYHQILLEKEQNLLQKKIIDAYVKKIDIAARQQEQKSWLQLYIDFSYMIYTLNLQDKFTDSQIQANHTFIKNIKINNKNTDQGLSESQQETDKNNILIGEKQNSQYAKLYSAIAWILHLNINRSKNIKFEHKLELLEFLYNNYKIFIEADKKFSQMVLKILQPNSDDSHYFDFFLQKLSSQTVINPIQHLYMIFLVCNKYNYRLDTYNLKFLLAQPKNMEIFEQEYSTIIAKYKQMYQDPTSFDIKVLLNQVLSHFMFQNQKVEDILRYQKDSQQQIQQQQQQQQSYITFASEFQQIQKDNQNYQKDNDYEEIKSFMLNNQNLEEKI